ncbi:hypothetical protein CC80DRAFT_194256 [Byssothecium circinans]|uniref:Uncharacterized protein n=1 Tax=Byssothecium circinans TaxID=147558 RepID=A0A6A5UCV7_9PLEO|nr:hypothetical protein CC80DRAFT_194256 [Byssothecium circinans]
MWAGATDISNSTASHSFGTKANPHLHPHPISIMSILEHASRARMEPQPGRTLDNNSHCIHSELSATNCNNVPTSIVEAAGSPGATFLRCICLSADFHHLVHRSLIASSNFGRLRASARLWRTKYLVSHGTIIQHLLVVFPTTAPTPWAPSRLATQSVDATTLKRTARLGRAFSSIHFEPHLHGYAVDPAPRYRNSQMTVALTSDAAWYLSDATGPSVDLHCFVPWCRPRAIMALAAHNCG